MIAPAHLPLITWYPVWHVETLHPDEYFVARGTLQTAHINTRNGDVIFQVAAKGVGIVTE